MRLSVEQRLGRQRLERGHAAPAAGLRRPGPHRAVVRADVLDVSRVRARHPHRLGRRPPRRRLPIDLAHARGRPIAEHRPSVVLLASPNNPTGTALPLADIEAILDVAPGMVVVDEAYAEFRRAGMPSALTLLPRYPRLVVTRTMSQGVRARRRPARLPRRRAGGRRRGAHRAAAVPPVRGDAGGGAGRAARTPTSCWRAVERAARRARPHGRPGCAGSGLQAADSDANFVLFGTFADRHAVWQGLLDRGRADPGDWSGRLAAGVHRHAGGDGGVPPRWTGRGTREQ